MVDGPGGSLLNFNTGITRVLNQPLNNTEQLPGKSRLTPTEAGALHVLDRLLSADNMQSLIANGLQPKISDRDVLQPGKFMDAVEQAIKDVEKQMGEAGGSPEDQKKLEGLQAQLNEVKELRSELEAYVNALIAG